MNVAGRRERVPWHARDTEVLESRRQLGPIPNNHAGGLCLESTGHVARVLVLATDVGSHAELLLAHVNDHPSNRYAQMAPLFIIENIRRLGEGLSGHCEARWPPAT